jgi:type III secretion protein C
MSARLWMGRCMLVAALAVGAPMAPVAHAAAPANWKDTGFSIDANGSRLRDVLKNFSRIYGVTVETAIDDSVAVRGRFTADTGTDFLERLGQAYNFAWFVNNGTVHIVSRTDNISMRLQIGDDAVQDAKAAMIGLGLFDSRFGWGELPDEGLVIVSGPRRYVELARDLLLPDEKKAEQKKREIMLFRLKYASAKDRVITTRGHSNVIPGVKTILRNLLLSTPEQAKAGNEQEGISVDSDKRSRKAPTERGGMREIGRNGAGEERKVESAGPDRDSNRPWKSKNGADDASVRIEANESLNAIMIYDLRSKREFYQSLIDQLDVQPQQVEIEALIVDIDRTKLSDIGIEWGVTNRNTAAVVNGMRSESLGQSLPIAGSTLLISNLGRFYARLKALEGSGEARVLATPTVLTLDNVAAVLDLSQTAYLPLTGERVAQLADVTAGTMLRVIPRIIPSAKETQVHLEVDIEDGSLDTTSGMVSAKRSTISTQAIVDLQQTLMIGGYHADTMNKDHQQTPVLGNVPLFGNLFKSTNESQGSRERLFMITPRLVQNAAQRAAEASTKVTEKKAAEKSAAASTAAPATPVAPLASAAGTPTAMKADAPDTASVSALPALPEAHIHRVAREEVPDLGISRRALKEIGIKLSAATSLSSGAWEFAGKTDAATSVVEVKARDLPQPVLGPVEVLEGGTAAPEHAETSALPADDKPVKAKHSCSKPKPGVVMGIS